MSNLSWWEQTLKIEKLLSINHISLLHFQILKSKIYQKEMKIEGTPQILMMPLKVSVISYQNHLSHLILTILHQKDRLQTYLSLLHLSIKQTEASRYHINDKTQMIYQRMNFAVLTDQWVEGNRAIWLWRSNLWSSNINTWKQKYKKPMYK